MPFSHYPPTASLAASDRSSPFAQFPNAFHFAPIFAGRVAPSSLADASTTSPNAAFFSEFNVYLAEAARRLTVSTAEVLFDRFGFATLDDFARRFERSTEFPNQTLLFADDRGARFLFLAPPSTLRLLFVAALGFDVAEFCADEALWADFNGDAQTPLTSFEQEAFEQTASRFATLSPLAFPPFLSPPSSPSFATSATSETPAPSAPPALSASSLNPAFPAKRPTDAFAPSSADVWRLVSSRQTPPSAALELDDALFYWERRSVRLGARLFPWTVVFSTRRLAPWAEGAFPCDSAKAPFKSSHPSHPSRLSSTSPTTRPSDDVSSPSFPHSPYSPRSSSSSPSLYPTQPSQTARSYSPFASQGTDEPSYPAESASSASPSSSSSLELAVVVERGEMSAAAWRRLKPGDVLTTDVPANALFLGLVDDKPRFLCRPGLFRGAAAVQIKSRADDDRE